MATRLPFVAAALIATAVLAAPGATGQPARASAQWMTISAITAVFNPGEELTTYSVKLDFPDVLHVPKDYDAKVTWTLKPPSADPACDLFYSSGYDATWQHGDKDGCNHNVYGAAGHPGTVRIVVTDNYGGRCVASYYGTVSNVGDPSNCGPPPVISKAGNIKAEKDSWDALSDALDAGAASEAAIGAGAGITGIGAPVTVLAGGCAAVLKVGALIAKAKAKDPPDAAFATVANPRAPKALHVSAGNGITGPLAAAFNMLARNEAQMVGYTNAMITAVNRASGAAKAGNGTAKKQQDAAAARYALAAAALDAARPALRATLWREAKLAGLHAMVTPATFRSIQQTVKKSGLPRTMVAKLRGAGVTSSVVAQIARAIATAKPPRSTVTFPNALSATGLDIADMRDAALLRAFATQLTS